MCTIYNIRHRNVLAEVTVDEFDTSSETWALFNLDEGRNVAWLLPPDATSINDCIQIEYDPSEDEERVRFRKPATRFSIRLVTTNDSNPISMMYDRYANGTIVRLTAQEVFRDCLPTLRQMALKDIQLERDINVGEDGEIAYYCNDTTFLAAFEMVSWQVTPKWAQDSDVEYITETVCQILRVLGRVDTRRLDSCILPPEGDPAYRDWEVYKVGLHAELPDLTHAD